MSFDIIGVGGWIIGIIGILIGIFVPLYFYRKSLRPKLLAVAYRGPFPLMLSIPGVRVTYLGAERKALSRTYILFWNRGTNPIEHSDFAVPIAFPDIEILKFDVIHKDPMAIVSITGRTLMVKLLRPSEAVVVQVDIEKYDRPSLVMPTKTPSMVVTIKRIPGIIGVLPGVLLAGTSVLVFGAIVVVDLLKLNSTTTSFVFPLLFVGTGMLSYKLGEVIKKKFTPSIPYQFLTGGSRELGIDEEEEEEEDQEGGE